MTGILLAPGQAVRARIGRQPSEGLTRAGRLAASIRTSARATLPRTARGNLASRGGELQPGTAARDLVLAVENLTKVYRMRRHPDVVAVDGVSFGIEKNEVVGLLGINGAGKTTIIKCICTLIHPTAGRVLVTGTDTRSCPRATLTSVAAVLEGSRSVDWRLTPKENLEFFAGLQGISARAARPTIHRLLELFRLEAKAKTFAGNLSRGMQQKLAVACALIKRTELVVLDEPTLGLDLDASHELGLLLRKMVTEEERTVLLSSHDMRTVQQVCDRVIVISQGRVLLDDSVSRLLGLSDGVTYRIRVSNLAEADEQKLRASFDVRHIRTDVDGASVEITLSERESLNDLFGLLHDRGLPIRAVESSRPALDDVFLSLVREGR